jgi:hypothetical protein
MATLFLINRLRRLAARRPPRKRAEDRLRRDSLEGIVWAVPAGGECAPVEGPGARQDNRLFLDGRAGRLLLFFRTGRKAHSPFHVARMALAIPAKRKGGQAVENKQLCEMIHFASPMISMTYGKRRETVRFARRKECRFFRLVEGQNAGERNQRRIRRARGGRCASQRLGNGAASRWNRSKRTRKWRRRLQQLGGRIDQVKFRMRRFAYNLRREPDFFYFLARNPLKSPDSDE